MIPEAVAVAVSSLCFSELIYSVVQGLGTFGKAQVPPPPTLKLV